MDRLDSELKDIEPWFTFWNILGLRVRVQVSSHKVRLLALLDQPTMAWLASAMSSQKPRMRIRKRNM